MSEVVYRIAKWHEVFERAESRKLKSLNWVAIPTSFSSNGFQLMLDEFGEDAPAIYGAWCALVAFAASCTVRGTLANSRGNPLKISHVSRIIGFETSIMTRMMQWAVSDSVAWLIPAQPHEIPQNIEELAVSGESPDASGEFPDYITGQDKTLHNTTRPDHTGDRLVVGRSSGENLVVSEMPADRLQSVDRSEVDRVCRLIVKSLPFDVDKPKLGRMVRVGIAAGVRSQMLETCKYLGDPNIKRPKAYWDAAVQKMVEKAGFDYLKAIETLEGFAKNSKTATQKDT